MTRWSDSSSDLPDGAMEYFGPQAALPAGSDMAEFGKALGSAAKALALRPAEVTVASARLAAGLLRVPAVAMSRWLGSDQESAFKTDSNDRRFADPTWNDNPAFYSLRQYYLGVSQYAEELISNAGLSPMTERKARFAAQLILDMFSPTNFLATNPAALRRAFETAGASVFKGGRNFIDDALHNKGRPRQVDTSSFTIGKNLAATACKVVYRNELMELLQYEPQTEQVHAAPLLCSPPWINKFYIMDLAPGRSFIEWAIRQNRTVFAISYLNPGPEMAAVTMDDYLIKGPAQALDVITDITGAATVDIIGLCLGGALTAITSAYTTQLGDPRVGNLTLLNTMLDYSEPGALALFTEPDTIDRLEKKMGLDGLLESAAMAETFNVLRAKDMIFNYVASNWLMGQDPPAFDILAWNADSTRMPAAMHAFYLRNFYVENRLVSGELEIAGQQIELGNIKGQSYIVSAENDHIVPWKSAYATTQLVSGPVRFVLCSGGHIAGVVNPPGPKGWYLTATDTPPTAVAWRDSAQRHPGSWWEDWAQWSTANAGDLIDPPTTGSEAFPVLGPGPGRYVTT